MKKNIKKITEKQLVIVLFIIILFTSLIIFLSTTSTGKHINIPYLSGATLTYFGNKDSYDLKKLEDYQGFLNKEYYSFSVETSKQKNKVIKYTTFIKPLEDNTINNSNIKVYLTDKNNVPQKEFRTNVSKIIDPYNQEQEYSYYDLYTIEIKDQMGNIKETGESKNPKFELYKYYQLNVLNKSLKDKFLVEENEQCLSYNLLNELNEPKPAEGCNIKLVNNDKDYESYNLLSDQEKQLYTIDTTSYKGTYIKINNQEYSGDIASYIAKKRNKQNESSNFYIKHVTGIKQNSSDKNYSYFTGGICYEYRVDKLDNDSLISSVDQVVDLSKCPNDYKIIDYEAKAITLGELDAVYQDEDVSLLTQDINNIIDQNYFTYEDGDLISDYNKNYYNTYFDKQDKRDYKLRYWMNKNAKVYENSIFKFRISVISNK